MTELVEIGIPAYNNGPYISETIRGCLAQDYPDIKIIVADDRSTDNTGDVSQGFTHDPRFFYILNEKNQGRAGNYRQLLYQYAKADWYVNLDGDDYFSDPRFISHAMQLINSAGGDEVAFFQGNHNLEKLKRILPHTLLNEQDMLVEGKDYFMQFPRIKKNTHCATLYNRRKALPLQFYSFDGLFSDFHSLSRLALTGKVILSSRKVAVWRQHEGNESKTLNEDKLQYELAALDDIAVFAKDYLTPEQVATWLREMKDYYRMVFIYHNSTHRPGMKTIGFILKHWRFDTLYFRYIIKNLLLMLRNTVKGKTAGR